jgi:hypothetical protein
MESLRGSVNVYGRKRHEIRHDNNRSYFISFLPHRFLFKIQKLSMDLFGASSKGGREALEPLDGSPWLQGLLDAMENLEASSKKKARMP